MTIVRADANSPMPARSDPATFRGVENWCARELFRLVKVDIFDGLTDTLARKERIRQAVVEHGLADRPAGKANEDGKPMTWRKLFERLYGERL